MQMSFRHYSSQKSLTMRAGQTFEPLTRPRLKLKPFDNPPLVKNGQRK